MDMDFGMTDVLDSAEAYEHLAVVHTARPRFKVNLNKQKEGCVLEAEDIMDEDELYDDDDEEEVFDTDLMSHLTVFGSDGDGWRSGLNESEKRETHFDLSEYLEVGFTEIEKRMEGVDDTAGAVKKLVMRTGNGHIIPDRSRLYFHYTAICEGSLEPFDTSLIRKHPYTVDLRRKDLIPGLEIALRSMELCEVARFIIQPEMAFGEVGSPPRIPANAKVMYVIEMVQYIGEKILNTPPYMTADERNSLPFSEIVEVSTKFRADGNGHYSDGNMAFAIKKWRKAINMLEDYNIMNAEDDKTRCDLLCLLYTNLAQGYLKLKRPAQACKACKIGLQAAPEKDSVKLLYRFAKAKLMLQDFNAADDLARQGMKVEPHNIALKSLRQEIRVEGRKSDAFWHGKYKPPKEIVEPIREKAPIKNSGNGNTGHSSKSTLDNQKDDDKRYEQLILDMSSMELELNNAKDADPGLDLEFDELVEEYAYCSDEVRRTMLLGEELKSIDDLPQFFLD